MITKTINGEVVRAKRAITAYSDKIVVDGKPLKKPEQSLFMRTLEVINSCKTPEQLEVARQFVHLAEKKAHRDAEKRTGLVDSVKAYFAIRDEYSALRDEIHRRRLQFLRESLWA